MHINIYLSRTRTITVHRGPSSGLTMDRESPFIDYCNDGEVEFMTSDCRVDSCSPLFYSTPAALGWEVGTSVTLRTRKNFCLQIEQHETFLDVKCKIEVQENIPMLNQRLMYKCVQVEDSQRLADHCVPDATLCLFFVRSGAPSGASMRKKKQPDAPPS